MTTVRTVYTEMEASTLGVTANIERVVDPTRGDHYGELAVQPLEYIERNCLDFSTGNVIKYVTRASVTKSTDQRLNDLWKARHYLDVLIQREQTRGL